MSSTTFGCIHIIQQVLFHGTQCVDVMRKEEDSNNKIFEEHFKRR